MGSSGLADFGLTAQDYARHRQTFPEFLFDKVPVQGRVLDLGSGTGALARGYAKRGARAVALDVSSGMLRQAADLPRVIAKAEACPFPDGVFDAVTAGLCWHWFDGPVVAREAWRLLRPGGQLVIAYFNYLAFPGSVAEASESLILERHPTWAWAGLIRMQGRLDAQIRAAGFEDLTDFVEELEVTYTHEAWRGRMRACNGVLALGEANIGEYDQALARLLKERFPDPIEVRHEVFALTAKKPNVLPQNT